MMYLDPKTHVPAFRQIAEQIRRRIVAGTLVEGDRLPPIRMLAREVGVNRNTAARAIQLLESEGLVRTRVGRGTFIATPSGATSREDRESIVDALLDRVLYEAKMIGFPLEEMGWRLSRRIERMRSRPDASRSPGNDA